MKKKTKKKREKRQERKKRIHKPQAHKKTVEKPSSIEFCDRCGSILVPVKKRTSAVMKCRKCGAEKKKMIKNLKITEEIETKKGVVVLEKDITMLPITDQSCEKCGNPKAYWWMQQTREADEPPTQFFRCTKCKFVWREYK